MNKRLMTGLILMAAVAMLLMGCTTTTTQAPGGPPVTSTKLDPQKIATVVSVAVPPAVQVAVGADTNCIPYLRLASATVRALVASGSYNPVAVQTALEGISVRELRTPEAQVAVQAGLAVYQAFAGQAVTAKIDASGYAVVLTALADGIDQGLLFEPIHLGK